MEKLIPVNQPNDIPEAYRNTPIGLLAEYQNLHRDPEDCATAQMLIGMCMDHRKQLRTPKNFAYIMRTGGANLGSVEFQISYAIGVAKLKHMVLMGHSQCGMSGLPSKRAAFIQGLETFGGVDADSAREHFDRDSPHFEIGDAVDFTLKEVLRLRKKYPGVLIAPMFYRVEDDRIYFIDESGE